MSWCIKIKKVHVDFTTESNHLSIYLFRISARIYRKKDIDKLERIQRKATKMILELRDLSYESRL